MLPPLIVTLVAGILLGITLWQRRQVPAYTTFCLILVFTALWGVLVFLIRSSPDTQTALFWDKPAGVFVFANFFMYYQFSLRIERVRPRTLLLRLGRVCKPWV